MPSKMTKSRPRASRPVTPPTYEDDSWTDSSNESEDCSRTSSVSSEEGPGPYRHVGLVWNNRGGNQPNTSSQKCDSESQTDLTGCVVYQKYYTGKSVVHYLEVFKVVRSEKLKGYMVQDAECQTKSTGVVTTNENIDKLRLLPIKEEKDKLCLLPNPLPRPEGNINANNFHDGMCDRSTLLMLITKAVPTLTTEMLNTLSDIIFNMVESQTNWEAIEAKFGIGQVPVAQVFDLPTTLNKVESIKEVSDVGCNTDAEFLPEPVQFKLPSVMVHRGTQATTVQAHKHTQTNIKTKNKSTGTLTESGDVKLFVDACVQTDIPVTMVEKETQTPSSFLQFLCSVFKVPPLGLFILLLSSVSVFDHIFNIINNLIYE